MTVVLWIGVFAIGGAGSVLRLLVDGAVSARTRSAFPVGTLVVNLSGAVVLGLLAGLSLSHDVALLAGTAAVGSYTTFSTWMLQTQRLDEAGRHHLAFANLAVSLVAGVAAAALGRWLGMQL